MKILSFSLYGDAPRYQVGAIRNAAIAAQLFPDWICRFYTSRTGSNGKQGYANPVLRKMKNVEVAPMHWDGKGSKPMFYRFLAASDPNAEYVCFRDCDSRLSRMEVDAIENWITSGATFHFLRGHPNHHTVKIMGGLWGIRGGIINDIGSLINEWGKWSNPRGDDQEFLAEIIWPIALKESRLTSLLHENPYKDGVDFVGQPFDEHERKLA